MVEDVNYFMKNPFTQTPQSVHSSFYISLLEFLLHAKQQVISIGDELGLTGLQAITLLMIDEHHPRAMKNFCLLFHCDASNITGIVDGLEQKGMVSRQNDPQDRRIKTVRLEPAGKRAQQYIVAQLEAQSDLLFGALSDTELKQFAGIIAKLAPTKKPAVNC
jgi:DNA-binding MarR family transcriptional regulator